MASFAVSPSSSSKRQRSENKGARSRVKRFTNVRVMIDDKFVARDLWVRDGRIIDPQSRFWEAADANEFFADETMDCKGGIIAPSFIDVQINGAFGIDFSSPAITTEEVHQVSRGLLEHGVTSYLATVVTSAPETYHDILPRLIQNCGDAVESGGARILGLHLEGPFINKLKKGAHAETLVASPVDGKDSVMAMYGSLDSVSMVTIAPELEGAQDAIVAMADAGVIVAVGHSMAAMHQAEDAVDHGATMITHLFNAMSSFHHRDPGLVGLLGSLDKRTYYSVIADGIHCHPASINMASKTHPDGLILVTDAMCAMGLPPGQHQLGTLAIDVQEDKAVVAGTDTLAGSVVSMITCVKNLIKFTQCPVVEALQAASLHPARLLGISDRKGTLAVGADADFVLLNDELDVLATYIDGNQVWQREDAS